MSAELDRLEQLFHAAQELASPEERANYLAQACGGDTALQARVERLLRAYATADRFLDPETPPLQARFPFNDPDWELPEKPGDQIGHYTLHEKIGEGGCSVVYLARQVEPVRREVALKLIKAGMDTRQVVARFEAERQALALMNHPAIAKVFDAGVAGTGRPYFVMELVRGIPITEYCDRNRLTVTQRLELFIQVCHAVQHAHQKGVIHRDLKPSNILVADDHAERSHTSGLSPSGIAGARMGQPPPPSSTHDWPLPKIIDFGIAKAMQAPLTHQAVETWAGQFIGTPAYMSPEQAAMNSEDIDARSDIYSLGALLYEMLTGASPFGQEMLAEASFDEIRQMIRETEPLKPSARLVEPARGRRPDSGRLNWKEVRGELDWIVMKALEKDRRQRYETVNDFAEDVQRFLSHEPVLAGPPSALYRARKFVRRHRMGVALAAAVTLALLAGLSVALVGLRQALRAEAVARQDRDRALNAEKQMRRERDRATQAEADIRGILSPFDEKSGAGDDAIALYYNAVRLARERLEPTNAAAMNFILPLGRNLGRRGAWSDALEVYRWMSEATDGNCDLWTQTHAAALAAGQPETCRQLRSNIVSRFGNTADALTAMQVARAVLIDPDSQEHLQTGLDCANRAHQKLPDQTWCQIVQGMAEFRRGRWPEALEVLQKAEHDADRRMAALAGTFAAMSRYQAGQAVAARETLERASRQLQHLQHTGVLPGPEWHFVVFGLVARAEAERLILGREVSPPVTVTALAEARQRWKAVREELQLADALARTGQWNTSRDAFARALDHPAFDWDAAEEESASQSLSLQMSIVFALAGDVTNQARFCGLLLRAGLGEPHDPTTSQAATARAGRYARACFFAKGQPEQIRQTALELARFAVTNQKQQPDDRAGWSCLAGGMAELYAGDAARALELLAGARSDPDTALQSLALVYRALALKQLNRLAESAQAIQEGEKLFETARAPGLRRAVGAEQGGHRGVAPAPLAGSVWHWWDAAECRLALQEAHEPAPGSVERGAGSREKGAGSPLPAPYSASDPQVKVTHTEIMVSPLMALPSIPRDAQAIAAGARHSLALRADGTVLGWGDHTSGQISIPASATNVRAISAGWEHSLALRSNGTLVAWGDNAYHQTDIPAYATNIVAIAAGHYHNLALRSDGTVVAWGAVKVSSYFPDSGQSLVPSNATHIQAIAAGSYHSLALRTNGTLVAWGLNSTGQCDIPAGATNVIAIAAGHGHSLALKRDGTLLVWGNNEYKYMVVGITNIPAEATNIVAIASGAFHCLALRADGRLLAWGLNELRQCVVPLTARGVKALAAGFLNSLAVKRDGTVVAWGCNDSRQCLVPPSLSWEHAIAAGPDLLLALRPDGTVVSRELGAGSSDGGEAGGARGEAAGVLEPQYSTTSLLHHSTAPAPGSRLPAPGRVPVPAEVTNVVAIAAGGTHRLALRANGTVVAWGENSCGQSSIPAMATNVIAVSAGNNHSLALRGDGTVVAWGDNHLGQTNVPASLENVVAIEAGYDRSLALRADGTVVAWGSVTSVPMGLSNVVALSVGRDHNLALRRDGTVMAWGSDDRGQCLLPAGLTNVVAIAASDGFGLALRDDGTLVWLGYSLHGFGPFDSRNPTGVREAAAITHGAVLKRNGEVIDLAPYHHAFAMSPEGVVVIAAGAYHDLALPLGGSHRGWVHGWGDNERHQATGLRHAVGVVQEGHRGVAPAPQAGVGYADPVAEWIPESWRCDNFVGLGSPTPCLLTNAISVAAGDRHSLALRADGTVVGWGDNADGQTSPPAGLGDVIDIAAGASHSLALKSDGRVVVWGSDRSGQRNPPPTATNVVAVAAGSRHSLALRADGSVVAWGDNQFGQGDVPAGLSHVIAIAAGDYHSLALKADRTVVGWGAGRPGTFGEVHYGQATVPAGLSNVVAIAAGRFHSLALRSDGTAIGWGDNYLGQTSVPAGATNLIAIAAGRYHSLFLKATATTGPAVEDGLFPIRRSAGRGSMPPRPGIEAR